MHSPAEVVGEQPPATSGSFLRTTAICTTVAMLGTLTYSVPLPVLEGYATQLGASAAASAWLQTAAAAPGAVLALALGSVLTRFGVRATTIGCLLCYAVGGLLCAFTDRFDVAIAARVLQGTGTVGLLVLGLIIAGDQLHGPQRDLVLSWVAAAMMAGGVVGPLLGGVVGGGDPRHAFLLYALSLLVVPLCLAIRPDAHDRSTPGPIASIRAGIEAVRAGGYEREFARLLLLSAIFLTLSNGVGQVVSPLFLGTHLAGHSASTRGWLLTLTGAASTATALLRPTLTKYIPSARLMWAAVVLFLVGVLTLATGVFALAVVAQIVLGMTIGMFYPGIQIGLIALTTPASRGSLVGIWSEAVRIAQLLAPLLAGYVFALTTPVGALLCYAVIAGAIALVVVLRSLTVGARPARHLCPDGELPGSVPP